MLNIKLSDEQMAELGVSTKEQVIDLLQKAVAADEYVRTVEENKKVMETKLEDVTQKLATLEQKVASMAVDVDALMTSKVNPQEIISRAITESTTEVMKFVARIGAPSLPATETIADVTNSQPQIAADDYKGQYAVSKELQREFSSVDTYVAYMRAVNGGQVKIWEPKKKE